MTNLLLLAEQIELSEQLLLARNNMNGPQELPGRFGRVIRDVDRVLAATQTTAVLAGGWAVWWHGYAARVTRDVDIVLPQDHLDDFMRTAAVAGFQILNLKEGRWPKVQHKDTDITVDILPEGGRPGTPSRLAPTLIRHPSQMGGMPAQLNFIALASLVELKIAAGRARDESDIVELVRAHPDKIHELQQHLQSIHADYAVQFTALCQQAIEEDDR